MHYSAVHSTVLCLPEGPNGGRDIEADEPADTNCGRGLRDFEDVLLRGQLEEHSFDCKGHLGHGRERSAVHLRLSPRAWDVLTQLRHAQSQYKVNTESIKSTDRQNAALLLWHGRERSAVHLRLSPGTGHVLTQLRHTPSQ